MTAANPLVPPHDLDAEMSVLSALMMSDGAIAAVSEVLRPEHFYRGSHGTLYGAALHLYGKGDPVDAITLTDELEKRGELEKVGGRGKVHEIAAWASASGNAGHYARIVRETATLRGLIDVGRELGRLGTERPGEIENLLDRAETMVFGLTQDGLTGGLEQLRPTLKGVFDRMETLAGSPSEIIGLSSGFRSIDKLTLGLQPGNLIILAARPSMGKSALALCIAANVAIRQELPVAFFTLEMSKAETVERLLSLESNVDLSVIRRGPKQQDEWSRIVPAAEHLDKAPFYADDANATMLEVRSKARRLKAQQPDLALVVVDYLQLLVKGKHEHKVAETGEIARQLKGLAKDLGVPVIALAQLNRNVEARNDKRPVLSDLRDSGEIEQHADLVTFLYRDDYYNADSDQAGIAELIVAKHRNGPTDTLKLAWLKKRAKFSELAA